VEKAARIQNKIANVSRVEATKQALREALLQLMQEKDYDTIGVAEVVARARRSRSTFYAYFENKEELLFSGHGPQKLSELFLHAKENRSVYVSLQAVGNLELVERHFSQSLSNLGLLPPGLDPIRSRFLVFGIYGVLKTWLEEGCPEPIPDCRDFLG